VVQGVGFRPFTARLARQYGLSGFVRNEGDRVLIETAGDASASAAFARELRRTAPGSIDWYRAEPLTAGSGSGDCFRIEDSRAQSDFHGYIPLDRAPCPECVAEFHDPCNRRYRYPLITCSDCGPRFTVMQRFPWDRQHTSMHAFSMCADCHAEFTDQGDRRFHAQTISCWQCGPQISLTTRQSCGSSASVSAGYKAMAAAADLLSSGAIIAVKGAGGYQLICRADSADAVGRLRRFKQRPDKPLALLAADSTQAARIAVVDEDATSVLRSPARPIVLLRQRPVADRMISLAAIAPANPYIGIMLPPTALHQFLAECVQVPLVVTSANRPGTPICIDDEDIGGWFSEAADGLLFHDRAILNRADDPVVHMIGGNPSWLRHGRGSAPLVLSLPDDPADSPSFAAAGADQKNSCAVAGRKHLLLSQHIGSMQDRKTLTAFEQGLARMQSLTGIDPEYLLSDLHPDYESRHWVDEQSAGTGRRRRRIQHHIAHVASCLLENRLSENVAGFAWDGTGYGADGTVWGGEVFLVKDGFRRVGSIRPFKLLGGDRAAREPWRILLALLLQISDREHAVAAVTARVHADAAMVGAAAAALATSIPPPCSSMGRLFDAAAALTGVAPLRQTYDGQAALALEQLAWQAESTELFPYELADADGLLRFDWRPTFRAMSAALAAGDPTRLIARRFHNTLAEVLVAMAKRLSCPDIVLTGGVFQNRLLTETAIRKLTDSEFRIHCNRIVPGNDAGIAAGQIYAEVLQRYWHAGKEAYVSFRPG
jgi:hydrogenase maturation protein HypF